MNLVLQPLKLDIFQPFGWHENTLKSRRHKKQWLKHSRFWRNSMPRRLGIPESCDVHNPNMTTCFQRLRLLEDGFSRNDWHIGCLATLQRLSLLPTLDLAEKTRRVKPLLWFRAMRRRPSPNRPGGRKSIFFVDVCLVDVTSIHMYM